MLSAVKDTSSISLWLSACQFIFFPSWSDARIRIDGATGAGELSKLHLKESASATAGFARTSDKSTIA